jgi:hypothetical protein
MTIELTCNTCFRHYRLKDKFAGQQYKCKQCGAVLAVPGGVDPLVGKARKLEVREAVRQRLVQLRLFCKVSRPPELEAQAVAEVEKALKCILPDEVLAALANGDDYLYDEAGLDVTKLCEYSQEARESRCPKDLVPIGRDADGHELFCISRRLTRTSTAGITTFCNDDGSNSYLSFPDWLDKIIERQQESLIHRDASLAKVTPTEADLHTFQPALI